MLVVSVASAYAQTTSPLVGKTVFILNPVPGDKVYLDLSGKGYATTALVDNWVTLTVPDSVAPHITSFLVRNDFGQGHWRMLRTGLGNPAGGMDAGFTAVDFQDKDSLWILIDPSGPPSAPPILLTEPPRIVNVLNPWPVTGLRLVTTGGKKNVLTVEDRCGWFRAYLLKPSELQLHLEEVNGRDTYGRTGLGGSTNYDMAAEFAKAAYSATGMHLWLDTDLNTWLTAFNDKLGTCQYMMAATVRDFRSEHPDFDFGALTGDHSAPGMIEASLSPDRRPWRSAKSGVVNGTNLFNEFESWWRTDETNPDPNRRSYETCVDIPMDKTGDGLWEYDSFRVPEKGFWPVENFTNPNNVKERNSCYQDPATNGWVINGASRNMNFCMESHARFIYQPGQQFVFRGDDDVWVFINDKLVLDLGGIHIPMSDTVDLDKLGLEAGKEYNWDFFYCDRQPCASSLRFKTSIYFKQQRSLFIEQVPGAGSAFTVRILKREGGKGSCGGVAGGDTVSRVPIGLTYQLLDVNGTPVGSTLSSGTHYVGITISPTQVVTIDTTKVEGLAAGKYRLIAYEPSNARLRVEIPFEIHKSTTIRRLTRPYRVGASKNSSHDAIGRRMSHPKSKNFPKFP